MEFPFQRAIEHKTYPRTFLHLVKFRFRYDTDSCGFERRLADFLNDYMGISVSERRLSVISLAPIRISRNEESVKCKITDDFVEITFRQNAYTSFVDSLFPLVLAFELFFSGVEAKLSHVSLRKINAMIAPNGKIASEAMEAMFSKDFMNQSLPFINEEDAAESGRRFMNLKDDEQDISVGVVSEISELKDRPNRKAISVMSLATCLQTIEASSLASETMKLNDVLYDCFHWIINPEMIKRMDKETER